MSDAVTSEHVKKEEGGARADSNILQHIKMLETSKAQLEQAKAQLEQKLKDADARAERLSVKTREGMQAAMDTLMKKWMDAVETKDETVKTDFKCGLDKLINNSAEENGVWRMMLAASSLHERQEHNLEKLRLENNELKTKVDDLYGSSASRVVGEKHRQPEQADRSHVVVPTGNIWEDFAKDLKGY
jgi:vacuolar-type H+-ATPase subunit H